MAVSFKVVDNRTSFSKKLKELENTVENFRTYFLQEMSSYIVLNSPVDTGTYMLAHRVGQGTAGGFSSSYGKPKNQPYEPYAQESLNNLFSSIEGLSGTDLNSIKFTNIAGHAHLVEHELGQQWQPYTRARAEANNIASRAASKAGM